MAKAVYTPDAKPRLADMISPVAILANLTRHGDLLRAMIVRDFKAAHRNATFGWLWTVLSPLIMLALFTVVFGYIFHGRFIYDPKAVESPADYALALFVGMSLFNMVSQTLGTATTLMLSNSAYVKNMAFPLELLPVAAVTNIMINLLISIGLCIVGFFAVNGYVHVTALLLPIYLLAIFMLCLGISWLLSSLGVFMRDLPSIIPPVSLVLMFASSVFFPIEAVPQSAVWAVKINPLAILIDQSRGCLMYGRWPDPVELSWVLAFCVAVTILGHWIFARSKNAFADVL